MDKQILHTYFAGEANPEEEKTIIDWTEQAPENYQDYLEERKYWNALLVNYDSLPKTNTIKRAKRVNLWMISAIAASVALIFVLYQQLYLPHVPEDKWQTIWVPPGQRAQVTLDDGSTVWLNSKSTLSFPSVFNGDQRIVKLNGEGFFEVEKNKEKPFVVQTAKYNIEVVGTSFNVLSYENHPLFETSLLTGAVQLKTKEGNTLLITLKPNERVTEEAGSLRLGVIENFDHFRWKEGLICLDDVSFGDLMEKFSLYFDTKIIIENTHLLNHSYTGKFRLRDGIDYALKVLQSEMKFNYTYNNEENIITIK